MILMLYGQERYFAKDSQRNPVEESECFQNMREGCQQMGMI